MTTKQTDQNPMRAIIYARVSTTDQNPANQIMELEAYAKKCFPDFERPKMSFRVQYHGENNVQTVTVG